MKRAQVFEGTWGHGPTKIPSAKGKRRVGLDFLLTA